MVRLCGIENIFVAFALVLLFYYLLGVTLPALWMRLEQRKPTFPLKLDPRSRDFLWRNVVSCNDGLSFFILEIPRADLIVFDRNQFKDPVSNVILEQVGLTFVPSSFFLEQYLTLSGFSRCHYLWSMVSG